MLHRRRIASRVQRTFPCMQSFQTADQASVGTDLLGDQATDAGARPLTDGG